MNAIVHLTSRAGADLRDLRSRVAAHGPTGLDAAECLALVLQPTPGVRALDLSLMLLERFGSMPEVLNAPAAALRQVAPPAVAVKIVLLHDLLRRTLEAPLRERPVLGAMSLVRDYLRLALAGKPREEFRVLFLDRRCRLIRDEVMGEGTVDHAPVYPREVLRRALELDASGLLLAHNHPGGAPTPSAADVEVTRQVVAGARALAITVHDHLLIGESAPVSFRALGLM